MTGDTVVTMQLSNNPQLTFLISLTKEELNSHETDLSSLFTMTIIQKYDFLRVLLIQVLLIGVLNIIPMHWIGIRE